LSLWEEYLPNQQGLYFLNQAFVVLMTKKENPQRISDYRSISLTYSFAKLITKILAHRLGPELEHLISINQTTFIKGMCIHDNFMFAQEVIRDLHKKKMVSQGEGSSIAEGLDKEITCLQCSSFLQLNLCIRWLRRLGK
jgi:hypothetical protein